MSSSYVPSRTQRWPALHWPGWAHLPRDARDTLFLLVVIAWTVLPHVPYLPAWCSVLVATVLAWRGAIAVRNAALPSRWVVFGVLVAVAVLTWWSHRTLLGKDAGITLVVSMMALKTLELRARRDAFVVFFLGFFLVLTQFLNSQSLAVAAAMLVAVWGLLTGLVLAHMPVGQPSLGQAARLAARAALFGTPVMALLFVLFPRVGPLWGVPNDAISRTGLSSTMTMGSVAQLALDDSIALRLKFDGAPPRAETLYFRGPVLSSFDGREWRRLESQFPWSLRPRAELRVASEPLAYEMTLEPQRSTVLPLLEAAPDAPGSQPVMDDVRVTLRDDLQWQTDRPVTGRLRFRAQAHLQFQHGPLSPVVGLRDHVRLPAGYNPRTIAWAESLERDPRHAGADASALAAAVLAHIRTGGYSYTLEPGTYGDADGRHAVDEFWLDRKLGFCEHFAAAFVVVMRALDVPARIVTGYQGADAQPTDGYMVVRNSYAHAWAEYWQPGRGWVRADPTAAVAPERIGLSRSLAPQPGFMAQALENVSPALRIDLQRLWETIDNRWNQWVLNYSRGDQIGLLEGLGFDSPRWEDMAYLLIATLSAGALAAAGWAWWDRRREDPWARQSRAIREALHRAGLDVAAHQPPREIARRVRAAFAASGEPVARLLEALDRQRYGREPQRSPSASWQREFAAEVRGLRKPAGDPGTSAPHGSPQS
jgi:transglutaminase-like putative cysteine protease